MDQLIRDHFLLFYAGAVAWCVIGMAYLLWRRKTRGPHFPPRDQVSIRFEEKWTTGRSCKSLLTRLGGASNCLRVTVTEDELWITPHFPFNAFAAKLDLDHRIHCSAIAKVESRGKAIAVEFATPDDQIRTVELRLRRPVEFLSALADAAANLPTVQRE